MANTSGHISHLQGWNGTSDPRTWTLPDNSGTIALTSDITTSFPLLAPNGTQAAPSYSFSSGTTAGMYAISATSIGISVGNQTAFKVAFNNQVTVGDANAAAALHIDANTATAASISFDHNSGQTAQISANDASNDIEMAKGGATVRCFDDGLDQSVFVSGKLIANSSLLVTGDVGFYNTSPVSQQTITGSRGGNAALADLLTKLALTGLIVDSTT
jgi:hypothetical protein